MNEHPRDNRVVLEDINWREALPFTNLFRTFRLAIHPSKLIFALAGVLICFIGGWFLDLLTGKQVVVEKPFYTTRMPADEIQKYISSPTMVEFNRWLEEARENNRQLLEVALTDHLGDAKQARDLIRNGEAMDNLASALETQRSESRKILEARYDLSEKILNKEYQTSREKAKDKEKDALENRHEQALKKLGQARDYLQIAIEKSPRIANLVLQFTPSQAADLLIISDPNAKDSLKDDRELRKDREQLLKTSRMAESYDKVQASQGLGIFDATISYDILMFNSAIDSVLDLHFYKNPSFKSFEETPDEPPGLVNTLGLAFLGLTWLVRVHWFYFTMYFIFCLAVWALAGGAICRIAALHATRDEKIPLGEAFGFASKKFLSFFSAPLMPILFVLGCCIPLILAGIIGLIPGLGELIVGLGFIVILLISVAMALVIIGGIGGYGMLYPTIAVEGSDTFDAFSRSYSYVYGRPWRTIFYTLVTAVYGTLCFVFVKLLVSLIFKVAYSITGATMNWSDASYAAPLGKLQAMWFGPSFSGPFFGQFYLFPLGFAEKIASAFIALWVFAMVGLVIAFAISFFFSGYTVIYLLLRRVVDSTEMDEVYVEEFETKMPEPLTSPADAPAEEPSVPAAQESSQAAPSVPADTAPIPLEPAPEENKGEEPPKTENS
jgi:hypothetical protein